MEDAGSWQAMRSTTARRARARRARGEAERACTDWPECSPQTALGEGALGAAQRADREIARLYAVRARKLAEFAGTRPASADRAQGEPGAMSADRWAVRPDILKPVSEWATQEAAIGLTRSQPRAQGLLAESCTLVTRLPGTLAALDGGLLTGEHLRPLLEHVAPIGDGHLRGEIEAEVLRWVAERAARGTITVPAQLAERVLRVVTRRGARDAAQQALKALAERGVYRRDERGAGLAGLGVVGTVPEIEALHTALAAHVDALPRDPEDTRSRAQQMLDVLCDLVLRPGREDRPPVQVLLTLVAGVQTVLGGDQPAELNGRVVSAETARQLLNALTGAGLGDGVLAELRRLAHGENPDTENPDTENPDTADASDSTPDIGTPDTDPDSGTPGTPGAAFAGAADGNERFVEGCGWLDWELPPQLRAALAEVEADWERRLWEGQFDDPDPQPDPAWPAGSASDTQIDPECDPRPDTDLEFDLERELAAAQARWEADLAAGRIVDPDPPQNRPASPTDDPPEPQSEDRPEPPPPGPGSRWWSEADRALAAACAAQWEAEQAAARAGRLVRTAARADAADETAWQQSAAGRVNAAEDTMTALRAAGRADRDALTGLLAATGGGGLAERPRIALVDALSGTLVSLTDLPGLRRATHCGRPACTRRPERCTHDLTGRPALGAPPPTDGYRPGAELDRFIRLRDQRCRWPGCRRPVCRGELDHRVRWPEGPTDITNLAGFCTGDHRAKHQAAGFHVDLTDDGALAVTTPSGITATTDAPPF